MLGQLKQHNNNINNKTNGANHLIAKNNVIRKHYKYVSNTYNKVNSF